MTSPDAHVVIVGAGHAGGTLAALLRQYGHAGPVTLVGEEPIPPYQRPPLSKAWLKGEADAESLALKPLEFYAENRIDFRASVRAARIDRERKVVVLSDGSELAYDILVPTAMVRPIRLPIPGAELGGILELRTAADAEALKGALRPGRTMAVVGGGYIGLEAAASARTLGADAVVLEREPRILARVAGEVLSTFFRTLHEGHGVRFLTGASVTGFRGEAGRVTGVELADGRVIDCDLALVGVGAVPNQELAQEAGLAVNRGVVVDLEARTSDPSIFAIGDVTLRPMPIYGRDFRMESVPNALEQAKQAACAITGRPAPAGETPWQWSDQYDIKLQIAGYNFDSDQSLVRGDPSSGRFAIFHLKGDQVQAVEAINSPPEFMMGRQLIGSRRPVDKQRLADPSVSMKEVAAA